VTTGGSGQPLDPEPYVAAGIGHLPIVTRSGRLVGWALVDAADLERLATFTWRVSASGYPVRRVGSRGHEVRLLLHREVLGLPPASKARVLHVNGDRYDARKSNLRPSMRAVSEALRTNPERARGLVWSS
jgi:hypothetical protein